jgi:hypothetical protein
MTPKIEIPPGYKLAEDVEEGEVIDIASNRYMVTSKTLNAFKEITLWMEMISLHALYSTTPRQVKATLTLDPKTIVKIHE